MRRTIRKRIEALTSLVQWIRRSLTGKSGGAGKEQDDHLK